MCAIYIQTPRPGHDLVVSRETEKHIKPCGIAAEGVHLVRYKKGLAEYQLLLNIENMQYQGAVKFLSLGKK